MDAPLNRWECWDYGSVQFSRDRITGDVLRVHCTSDSLFGGGLFRLIFWDDRQVFLSFEGDDESRSVHFADSKLLVSVVRYVDPVTGEEYYKVTNLIDPPQPSAWQSDLQHVMQKRVLIIHNSSVQFEAEWAWSSSASLCGDKPVSLWLGLEWLLEYVRGPVVQRNITWFIRRLREQLASFNLDVLHVRESKLSRERKRHRMDAQTDPDDEIEGEDNYLLSIVAVIVFLQSELLKI